MQISLCEIIILRLQVCSRHVKDVQLACQQSEASPLNSIVAELKVITLLEVEAKVEPFENR